MRIYVWDPSFFHTLPNGVDAEVFKPMDKAAAKREIAKIVGDDRIESASDSRVPLQSAVRKRGIRLLEVSRTESRICFS